MDSEEELAKRIWFVTTSDVGKVITDLAETQTIIYKDILVIVVVVVIIMFIIFNKSNRECFSRNPL